MARAASRRSRASSTAGRVAAAVRPSASASPSGRAGTRGIANRAGSTGDSSPRSAASRAAASPSSSVARASRASERAFSALSFRRSPSADHPSATRFSIVATIVPRASRLSARAATRSRPAYRAEVEARRLEDDRLELAARCRAGGPRHRGRFVPAGRPCPEDGERLRQLGDDVDVGLRIERGRLRAAAPVLHSQRGLRVRQASRLRGARVRGVPPCGGRGGKRGAFGGGPEHVLEGNWRGGGGGRLHAPNGEGGGRREEEKSSEPAHRLASVTPFDEMSETRHGVVERLRRAPRTAERGRRIG